MSDTQPIQITPVPLLDRLKSSKERLVSVCSRLDVDTEVGRRILSDLFFVNQAVTEVIACLAFLEGPPLHVKGESLQACDKFHAYGHCPKCGKPGSIRERRPNGNDQCEAGHSYPAFSATECQYRK